MRFSSPWAFSLLSFIPIVILMYILKQKFEERQVSSIFLWSEVLKDIEVNTPWQKLKRNLLLFLQILAIVLFTLALANPFIFIKGRNIDNIIIVIDNSGSMNALSKGVSGLNRAKREGENLIKSVKKGSNIAVISSSLNSTIKVSNTKDKASALKSIENIEKTNSKGDINSSVPLVKSIAQQYENYKAYFYTDSNVELKGLNGEVNIISTEEGNVSLDYISHSVEENELKVLLRVTNRSNEEITREISLFGEEELVDFKDISLAPNEMKTVYFTEENSSFEKGLPQYIKAEISEKDALNEDNYIYDVVQQKHKQKTILVSEGNVFIEKALGILNNIELYKANSPESVSGDYDLYIFDGTMPKELPSKGNILFINPSSNKLFKVNGEAKGGVGTVVNNPITEYMENAYFTVSNMKDLELPTWGEPLIKVGNKVAVFIGESEGHHIGAIGFDIHKSDFALTTEFPIFMNNLISYLVGGGFMDNTKYYAGEDVSINILPNTTEALIQKPSKEVNELKLTYPMAPYRDTSEIGIYKLTQKLKEENVEGIFAVNFPSQAESGTTKAVGENLENNETSSEGRLNGVNISIIFMILILVLIMIEWIIYLKRWK